MKAKQMVLAKEYYEFYEDSKLLYKFDALGNIIKNEKFLDFDD